MGISDRDAIVRASFFLEKAKECPANLRNDFEAYLEASIIFGRAAIHRLKSRFERHLEWKSWWNGLLSNPSVLFIAEERNWILKIAPPMVGQIVRFGEPPPTRASELYFYDNVEISAVTTIEQHLHEISRLVHEAEELFG